MSNRDGIVSSSPILVTGGTGTLGRQVVDRLSDRGRSVRILTRGQRAADTTHETVSGDLSTGEGTPAAVEGVDVVVHCAGSAKGDDIKAGHLISAAVESGIGHVVYISVVGANEIPIESAIDRALFGYYAGKHGGEKTIAESGLPWTILRATNSTISPTRRLQPWPSSR